MTLDPEKFLPYRLNRLAEAVSADIRPVYKERFGMNRPEWRVLVALADLGPTTAKAICGHSAQHKTKVSRAVAALERRRWLKRATDAADRRFEILSMTPAGARAYSDLVGPMTAREDLILDRLSRADRAALDRALSALETAMGVGPERS